MSALDEIHLSDAVLALESSRSSALICSCVSLSSTAAFRVGTVAVTFAAVAFKCRLSLREFKQQIQPIGGLWRIRKRTLSSCAGFAMATIALDETVSFINVFERLVRTIAEDSGLASALLRRNWSGATKLRCEM
jgi:hypothetical protein